jgi:signal transduction histidine kinase
MSYWLELEKRKNMSSMQTIAFASAAHEFKNPLNAIVSSLEIMEPLIDLRKGG